MKPWIQLGAIPPRRLVAARLELHRAAQIVADVGRTFGPARTDDSHTNLRFVSLRHSLAGVFTPDPGAMRAFLKVVPLCVSVQKKADRTLRTLPLAGLRAEEAWSWMDSATGKTLSRFRFEIEDGPGGSKPFQGEPASHFEELEAWYANAANLLGETRKAFPGASTVRCWPHHFDIAFLLPISRGRGKTKGSIGVGLSPGDEQYPEPYWYVTPWPHADRPVLPELSSGGHWHKRGWTGAVLTGSRVVAAGAAREQARASSAFLKNAIHSAKNIIRAATDKP